MTEEPIDTQTECTEELRKRRVKCEFRNAAAGPILIDLYYPSQRFDLVAHDAELIDYCLTLIGRRAIVYWIGVEMSDRLFASKHALRVSPMVFKKIRMVPMQSDDIMPKLEQFCQYLSREKNSQISGIVINLRTQFDISAFDVSQILDFMRKMSTRLQRIRNDQQMEKHRILICLPSTNAVLNAISRQPANLHYS